MFASLPCSIQKGVVVPTDNGEASSRSNIANKRVVALYATYTHDLAMLFARRTNSRKCRMHSRVIQLTADFHLHRQIGRSDEKYVNAFNRGDRVGIGNSFGSFNHCHHRNFLVDRSLGFQHRHLAVTKRG